MARLKRLAQSLQRGAGKLGQLIQKQNAVMRQTDFARTRRRATAHERHRTGRMVRRGIGAAPPVLQQKLARQASQRGAL